MPIRLSAFSESERGSLAPLGIGLAMISLTAVLVVISSGSLYLTERRLTGVAESTALNVLVEAEGNLQQDLSFYAGEYLSQLSVSGLHQLTLIEASSSDARTVRIRLCSLWRPIFDSYLLPEIGRVCSEGLARRGR